MNPNTITTEHAPHPRVLGALTAAKVAFNVRRHSDCLFAIRSPEDFARCMAVPLDAVLKTLFVRTDRHAPDEEHALVVCPMPRRIDWEALARELRAGRVELASREALSTVLGYSPKGVSPLGVAPHRVVIDEDVFARPVVYVGAGVPGVEIELAPEDLLRASAGLRLAVSRP